MKLTTQRRLAAQTMKCGESRVWFDPRRIKDIKEAITNQDIRSLVHDLAIQKHAPESNSSFRHKKSLLQKRKGRKGGHGSRKGTKSARLDAKTNWINKVRAQRKFLKSLKSDKKINTKTFGELYSKSKGGFFRSKKHIQRYMEEHSLVNDETQNTDTSAKTKKAR